MMDSQMLVLFVIFNVGHAILVLKIAQVAWVIAKSTNHVNAKMEHMKMVYNSIALNVITNV